MLPKQMRYQTALCPDSPVQGNAQVYGRLPSQSNRVALDGPA